MKKLLIILCLVAVASNAVEVDAGVVLQAVSDHVHKFLGTASGNSPSGSAQPSSDAGVNEHIIKNRNTDDDESSTSPSDISSSTTVSDSSTSTSATTTTTAANTDNLFLDELIVETTLGKIKGAVLKSRSGLTYVAFKGIKYGVAKRFERAELPPKWEGVKDALNYSAICPQVDAQAKSIIGDEFNCLSLNIFVPTSDRCQDEKVLPSYFKIHGGAFTLGAGEQYGEQYFMDECVVYVSVNYRLGAFGFLATNDGVIEGNLGIKDVALALKLFGDNAQAFRSSRDMLAISGISAGSVIVSHLVVSPAAKGLFSRAIAQSGSSLAASGLLSNPSKEAEKLGRFLNCSGTSSVELRNCFLAADYKTILSFQESFIELIYVPRWNINKFLVAPVLEPETVAGRPNHTPFVTTHPYHRMKNGDFNRVPIISGFTKDEGLLLQAGTLMQNPQAIETINKEFNRVMPIALFYDRQNLTQDELNHISDKIRDFYFQNKTVSEENFDKLIDVFSDRWFVQGTMKFNELHSKFAPVYPYIFNYLGSFSIAQVLLKLKKPVVSHGHDAQFLYVTKAFGREFDAGSEAEKMTKNLVKMWVHFTKTGEPGKTWTEGVYWKQPSDRITFNIDNPASSIVDYGEDRRQFWENLGLYEKEFV